MRTAMFPIERDLQNQASSTSWSSADGCWSLRLPSCLALVPWSDNLSTPSSTPLPHRLRDLKSKRAKSPVVDPRGIEPLSKLCHSFILPVYDGPQVDLTGVEPVISAMRMRRITNCATGPETDAYYTKFYLKNCEGLTGAPFTLVSK